MSEALALETVEVHFPKREADRVTDELEKARQEGQKAYDLVEKLKEKGITQIGLWVAREGVNYRGNLFIASEGNKVSELLYGDAPDITVGLQKGVLALFEYTIPPILPNNPSYKGEYGRDSIFVVQALVKDPHAPGPIDQRPYVVREGSYAKLKIPHDLAATWLREEIDDRWKNGDEFTILDVRYPKDHSGGRSTAYINNKLEELGIVLEAVDNSISATAAPKGSP